MPPMKNSKCNAPCGFHLHDHLFILRQQCCVIYSSSMFLSYSFSQNYRSTHLSLALRSNLNCKSVGLSLTDVLEFGKSPSAQHAICVIWWCCYSSQLLSDSHTLSQSLSLVRNSLSIYTQGDLDTKMIDSWMLEERQYMCRL